MFIYLSLHCHHRDDFRIKAGSDVSEKVTRQCPQTTTFEENGKPKEIPTEVPLLTSLTPYRWATPAHEQVPSTATYFQ